MHLGRYENPFGLKYFKLKIAPYRKELLLKKKCLVSFLAKRRTHSSRLHTSLFSLSETARCSHLASSIRPSANKQLLCFPNQYFLKTDPQ